MKLFRQILTAVTVVAMSVAVTSCIENEPLNTECDIETATLADGELLRSPEIKNDRIIMIVKDYVDLNELAPEFTLTPGATIEPASGTVRNFTQVQSYTVTSQDGKWSKVYEVEIRHNNAINLQYGFENVRLVTSTQNGHYDEFIEYSKEDPNKVNMVWASGNAGFALTNGSKGPDTYPTFQTEEGKVGKCVELITRSTGTFGAMVGMPMAAGNLFIGQFDITNAVAHPMEATHFGTSFKNIPTYFRGYYKYTASAPFMQLEGRKLVEVPGKVDQCDIYAVFYESTPEMEYLDGNNVLSDDNPNILAIARLDEESRKGAADWTYFDLPFVFRQGATIDPEKFEAGAYCLAVVMTSSIEGAGFSGAIGSTLYVDELEIVCL